MKTSSKRQYRRLKQQIQLLLMNGSSVSKIAKDLHCSRTLVYWHKCNADLEKRPNLLQNKIDRFNRRIPYGLDVRAVSELTNFKCLFSGQSINLNTDSYCLGALNGMPILYLTKYRIVAQTLEKLRANGWTIEAPIPPK